MPYSSRPGQRSGLSYRHSAHFGGRPKQHSTRRASKTKKEYIHPSRFVKVAQPAKEAAYQPVHCFDDFAMHSLLKRNIRQKGFVAPSPVQDQAIPAGLAGKDIVGLANTGTGKTIAFALPVLNRLLNDTQAKALIVAPTRELAQQIEEERRNLGRGCGLFGALLIGGSSMGLQLRDLERGVRIVVGTPGRIKDHMQRGSLKLADFNLVVLDEVDRMLDMGFVQDMRDILAELQPERQSFFFSATLDERVRGLIKSFTDNAVTISVASGDTNDNIHQDIVPFETLQDKIDQLHNILRKEEVAKVIVFDETQRSVERLGQELRARGFRVDDIHGGKSQGQRKRALSRFKQNEVSVLVATDVAARGLDVADVTHVINYTLPQSYQDYVHRIGRAGRAGRIGYALTFVQA